MEAKRILIRVPNWIGDAMISLPALRVVRGNFPQAHMTVLARPWVADLYHLIPEVNEIFPYAAGKGIAKLPAFLKTARKLRRLGFDLAILFQNAFEAAFLAAMAGIPARIGYDVQWRRAFLTRPIPAEHHPAERHQMHYYLRLLSSAGLRSGAPDFRLQVPDRVLRESESSLPGGQAPGAPCIGFNMGAYYGSAKRWPPDRFVRLVEMMLKKTDARVMVFGMHEIPPGEHGHLLKMGDGVRLKVYAMLPLLRLTGLISRCALFVTNDSGPMHLAAALGVPVVAVFGPTDEGETGPLGEGHVVIRKRVDCTPCRQRECPEDHRCMKEISQDEVFEVIQKKLSQGKINRDATEVQV